MDSGKFSFGLEQIEKALSIDPKDLIASQYKGIVLGRLKKFESAKEWMRSLVKENPKDPETLALLGRVEKDAWVQAWKGEDNKTTEQMTKDAAYEEGLLKEAIDPYLNGFIIDPAMLHDPLRVLVYANS
jgi:tetratricopeptide (TPR) repeat protein